MSTTECAREQDVLDGVASGRWPERCAAELRAHVAACPVCADVAAVARALAEEHAWAWQDARVPPAGVVWWRLEMRARQEAVRLAARPITFVQVLAAACAAGVAIALIALSSPWLAQWVGALHPPAVALWWVLPVAGAVAASLALAPVVLYLVFSDD